MVLIRALRDYCRIRWDNACKVRRVPIAASAPQNRVVITLTTSLSSLRLPHSLPGAFSSSATRLILNVWLFTENQQPGWLFWLQGQSCPSTHWYYLPTPRCDGTTTLKASLEMFEVRLHSPIVRPPSPESSRPRGSQAFLSLDSGTVYPFVPSETFWAEDAECPQVGVECSCSLLSACHQYPHLSVVLVTWPIAPVPGLMPTSQQQSVFYHPERNTLIKYVAGLSNPQVDILWCVFIWTLSPSSDCPVPQCILAYVPSQRNRVTKDRSTKDG